MPRLARPDREILRLAVPALGALVARWLAYSLWLAARFVTLVLRARGSGWLVTGAVRR
jgi:hypothetical protein